MRKIVRFLKYEDKWSNLYENIKLAELLLVQQYADKKNIAVDKVTPQQKEVIEQNPKYLKIKSEFESKNPRLIYPMTKFYIVEDAPWDELIQLMDRYEKAKLGPKEMRLGPIEMYAKVTTGDGWKQFATDLDKAIEAKEERLKEPKEQIERKANIRPEIVFLVERYAKAKKIDPKDVTEEQKVELTKDPDYQELKRVFLEGRYRSNSGETKITPRPELMFAFTKFRVIENTPISKLLALADKIEQYKPESGELRHGNIDNYAKLDKKQDPLPGAEVLSDDIDAMVMNRKAKKMVDLMPKRMREKFREVAASNSKKDKERIKKLVYIANRLESLDPKEMTDKKGNIVIRTALEAFIKKSKKYDDYKPLPNRPATYPEFADIDVAFDQMIKDGDGEIEGWTSGVDDLRQKLINLEPATAIIYDDDNYIVSSSRTYEGMVEVCKLVSGNHCIRSDSNFWSHTRGGYVQMSISDFNRKQTDKLALYTMTIAPDGKLKESAGSDNNMSTFSRFTGKPFEQVLKHIGYPEALINTATRFFPEEQRIKAALEKIYTLGNRPQTPEILTALTRVHEGVLSGVMSNENWNRICGLVAQIIRDQLQISDWEFVNYFTENGIITRADFKIFQYIIGNKYKPEDAEKIKEATKENIEIAEYIITDKGSVKALKPEDLKYFQEMVKNKQSIIDEVEKL